MIKLSGQKKAAIIIVMLGKENASKILKHLNEDDVKSLSFEVARLGDVSDEDMKNTLQEFYSICLSKKMFAEGGIDSAREILESAFGPKVAESYLKQIDEMMNSSTVHNVIKSFDEQSLLKIIKGEHPQTIAFILSNAKPEQVSAVISKLPKETGIDVIARIAKIGNVSKVVLKEMEKLVSKKLKDTISDGSDNEIDGLKYVTDVMNNVTLNVEKTILEGISEKDPELSDEIMKKMFVFEDVIILDPQSLQKVLRLVDKKDLALAVKGANPEIVQYIYSNLSSRVVESVKEEISYMRNVRISDVETAQQNIVQLIRSMMKSGEIIVDKSGKDGLIG